MAQPDLLSPEWLLVKTCQDLVQRSKSGELYDKIRMAGLLEQLLIGEMSLVARVNRDAALPIEFWYREPEMTDAARWTSPLGFDASQRRTALGEVKRAGLEAFLAARVIHAGTWLSVEQLLRTVTHCYGGAYSPPPAGLDHATLAEVDRVARTGPASTVAVGLHEVTGTALRALIPLAESRAGVAGPGSQSPSTSRPKAPRAPAGSGCPFAGKLDQD